MGRSAAIAANRFGLGPLPGESARIKADPQQWLLDQLQRPIIPAVFASAPGSAERIAEFHRLRGLGRGKGPGTPSEKPSEQARKMLFAEGARDLQQEIVWRTQAAVETPAPFLERLVHFWANHFTVSITNRFVTPLAGPYEREAIRPNVTAKFEDLLQAAVFHPAMLLYLDNAVSIGPNSLAGVRRGKGLNENLAREILELHTLGVDGGYTQDDVIALAKMLTGWTIDRTAPAGENPVRFMPRMHEPGAKVLLGKRYPEDGPNEAKRALIDLARNRATAQHVAKKIAVHFIADEPPPQAIAALAKVFSGYGGDLQKVFKTLIELDEPWAPKFSKVKAPQELLISCIRVCGVMPGENRWGQAFKALGQPIFNAPSPAGWPDTAEQWLNPDAVVNRLELCRSIASTMPAKLDARLIAIETFQELLSATTKRELERAPSPATALALLFASPEFQRR